MDRGVKGRILGRGIKGRIVASGTKGIGYWAKVLRLG